MYHLINPVPRCIFHSHMPPTNNIKIVYKTKLGVGLTEIQGFEEWLKNDIYFFDQIN